MRNKHLAKMVLEVAQGNQQAAQLIVTLYNVRPKRFAEIMDWFVRNGVKGEKLVEFFMERDMSILSVVAGVIGRIDKERLTKLYAGEHFEE